MSEEKKINLRRISRVQKEYIDFCKDPIESIDLTIPDFNDYSKITGIIYGPKNSPYEGGKFYIDVELPNSV